MKPTLSLALLITTACALSLFFPSSPMNLPNSLKFGSDAFGKNIFLLTLQAGAKSGTVSLAVTALALSIGALMGLALATTPRFKIFFIRLLDFWICFPSILIALSLSAWVRSIGLNAWASLWLSLILGSLPTIIRLTYLKAQQVLTQDYVAAAISLGATRTQLTFKHIFPAVAELLAIKAPSLFAATLLTETTLSFLGLGAPLGEVTLGSLLLQGKDYLIEAPHIALVPGAILFFYSISLITLSEHLSTSWTKRYT